MIALDLAHSRNIVFEDRKETKSNCLWTVCSDSLC